ncbi:MAG: hypothetical protein WAO08_24005 [Hyphomicrobiaceae bacterium]
MCTDDQRANASGLLAIASIVTASSFLTVGGYLYDWRLVTNRRSRKRLILQMTNRNQHTYGNRANSAIRMAVRSAQNSACPRAHGASAIVACREQKPDAYLMCIAKCLPKEVNMKADGSEAFLKVWEANRQRIAKPRGC